MVHFSSFPESGSPFIKRFGWGKEPPRVLMIAHRVDRSDDRGRTKLCPFIWGLVYLRQNAPKIDRAWKIKDSILKPAQISSVNYTKKCVAIIFLIDRRKLTFKEEKKTRLKIVSRPFLHSYFSVCVLSRAKRSVRRTNRKKALKNGSFVGRRRRFGVFYPPENCS